MNKYSLANHLLTITPTDNELKTLIGDIVIGGDGHCTDSIAIRLNSNMWTTTAYATGGWVHTQNLDRSGTISVSISQLSQSVQQFIDIMNKFYEKSYLAFEITLTEQTTSKEICNAQSCLLVNIPEQSFGSTPRNQTWSFTCGKIIFTPL